MFQFYNLIPNLDVEENVLPLLLDGQKAGNCRQRLDRILEIVGLSHRRRHKPRELSGGRQGWPSPRAGSETRKFSLPTSRRSETWTAAGEEIMKSVGINRDPGRPRLMVTHSPEAAGRRQPGDYCAGWGDCLRRGGRRGWGEKRGEGKQSPAGCASDPLHSTKTAAAFFAAAVWFAIPGRR